MEIPAYPVFTPITLEQKDIFDAAFRINPPVISEFTFTNIYCWRRAYDFKIALLDGFLILRADSAKFPRFFLPIGSGEIKPVIERLLLEGAGELIRIPQEAAALLEGDQRFKITEDAANADYLYLSSDLIALKGAKYDGKRNLIRKFKSGYVYSYEEAGGSGIEEILEFEEIWCAVKDCEHVLGLVNERRALEEMISCFGRFALEAGLIRIEGKIRAVAIGEALNPETFVVHILKADPAVAGLYQALNNEFLRAHAALFKYVNLEQDLGVSGLRASKESYHPLRLVKKYIISLRGLS